MIPALKYAADVSKGKITACKYVKLAIQRHFDDLEMAKKKKLIFKPDRGEFAIQFFSLLKHSKGVWAGQYIELSPWQQFIIYCLFGWYNQDGSRRFRTAYLEMARKNGKTTMAAGICLYMLALDAEEGAEVYLGATKRDQARIAFEEAARMVRASNDLQGLIKIYKNSLYVQTTNSKLEAISSDSNKQDGLNPHLAYVDEYHAHKTSDLYDVLKSGMGARFQPLQLVTTTAGFDLSAACYQMRKTCIEVLEGLKEDDSLFSMIYSLDDGDEWSEESNWIKANPNLGITPSERFLRSEFNAALNDNTKQVPFKTKNLNVWVNQQETIISAEQWRANSRKFTEQDLLNRECWAGVDFASKQDFNALTLYFPEEKEKGGFALFYFWIPEETYKKRIIDQKSLPWAEWVKRGWLRLMPGNVRDDDFIINDIVRLAKMFQFQTLAYDPFKTLNIPVKLEQQGIETAEFRQGFISMGYPTEELFGAIAAKEFWHDGNGCMAWQVSNIALEIDASENKKISKKKASEKVDGPVSAVMAYGEWLSFRDSSHQSRSVYEGRGILKL